MAALREWAVIAFLTIPTLYWPVVAAEMLAVAIGSDVWSVLLPMYPVSLAIIAVMYYKNDYIKGTTEEEIRPELIAGYLCVFASNVVLLFFNSADVDLPALGGLFIYFNFFAFHFIHSTKLLLLEANCRYEYFGNNLQMFLCSLGFILLLYFSITENERYIVHTIASVSASFAAVKVNAIYHGGLTVIRRRAKKN